MNNKVARLTYRVQSVPLCSIITLGLTAYSNPFAKTLIAQRSRSEKRLALKDFYLFYFSLPVPSPSLPRRMNAIVQRSTEKPLYSPSTSSLRLNVRAFTSSISSSSTCPSLMAPMRSSSDFVGMKLSCI